MALKPSRASASALSGSFMRTCWIGLEVIGADQLLHHVEQPLIGQQSEHGRAGPHRRVVADAALRERDVEVPGDVLPALFGHGDEPLLEGELFQRGRQKAIGHEPGRDGVEDGAPFVVKRSEIRVLIKNIVDDDVGVSLQTAPQNLLAPRASWPRSFRVYGPV